ncbi:MAG TPA: peptidyl-alpha-hydroxyglycine alpha-amidating lyase family protein [Micropepsaceae bacterium]|nr:peptidyl-alpha-hydroxyglycine alpha-amidating lyase family protein [Micropepsaceae bacterium]
MRRAHDMRYALGIATIAATALSATVGFAQSDPNSAPNPYRADEGWAKHGMGRNFGSTPGLALDRDGKSLWVFDRCGGNTCENSNIDPVTKYDASGKVVTTFGAKMFVRPHGVTVDNDGNIWATDGAGIAPKDGKPGKGQTVMKFSPEGKVLMTLGTPGVTGVDGSHFNAPSDVLIAPNGDIFIADGHGEKTNARIVKFSKDGKFIKAWGKEGKAPGEFDEPHGLAMDSAGRLFVADRANSRIQIFDQDGKFLAEWKQFGRPSGIAIDKNDVIYVADSQSDEKVNPGFKQGIRVGSAKDGKVTAYIPENKDLGSLEATAFDESGDVYAGYTGAMNLRRFVKK